MPETIEDLELNVAQKGIPSVKKTFSVSVTLEFSEEELNNGKEFKTTKKKLYDQFKALENSQS